MGLQHQIAPKEKLVSEKRLTVSKEPANTKANAANTCPTCGRPLKKTKADRRAYMREFMRKKRAKERLGE